MKKNWIITLVCFTFLICSCKHTKDLQKKSTTTKSDSTASIVSITTSTETTTGTLDVKGDTLTGEEDADEISEHPITIEDEDLKLIVTKDKKTGKIKATAIQKPKVVPIKTVKVTNNKTDTNIHLKKESESKTKDVKKEVTGGLNLNYLWWLLLLLIIPVWQYLRRS